MNMHRQIDNAIGESIRRQREQGCKKTGFGHYWEIVNGVLVNVGEMIEPALIDNVLPTEGINYLLDIGYGATAKAAGWYLGLYANAVNPAANWTAANVASTAGEITSTSEGYSQATRPQFNPTAAASGAKDNVGNEAAFTIVTATALNVEGVFLISDNARGGTAGKLGSAARYPATRVLMNADNYLLGYRVTITS